MTNKERKEYDKKYYQKNKLKRLKQAKERRKMLLNWIWSIKSNPCMDCGGTFHPISMQFDHLRNKYKNISDMIKEGYGKESILKETLKCDLVCSNCHAVRTYNRKKEGSNPVR